MMFDDAWSKLGIETSENSFLLKFKNQQEVGVGWRRVALGDNNNQVKDNVERRVAR